MITIKDTLLQNTSTSKHPDVILMWSLFLIQPDPDL